MAEVADIRARLQSISEELADAGMDVLREAVAAGATKRPDAERQIAKARRAVERAVTELDRLLSATNAAWDEDAETGVADD